MEIYGKIWDMIESGSQMKSKFQGQIQTQVLKFDSHVLKIYTKSNRTLIILNRLILKFEKRRVFIKAYFGSQFKYCPFVWIFHQEQTNDKINSLHERALRMFYEDNNSSFHGLLENNQPFSIQSIQQLTLKMRKVAHGLKSIAL